MHCLDRLPGYTTFAAFKVLLSTPSTQLYALQIVKSPSAQRLPYAEAQSNAAAVGVDRETPTTPFSADNTTAPPPSASADQGNGDEGSSMGVVVGGIIAAAIVLVGIIAGVTRRCSFSHRHRNK